ncbi:MAG: hypothetical protein KGJ13_10315 [Patescibacteria group bacterium]|nr:hypothetical protein [Patescibacteria group bacterium]
MKTLSGLIVSLFLCMASVFAQAPASSKFNLTGQVAGVFSAGTKMVAADAAASYTLSPQVTLRTDNLIISAASSNASLAAVDLSGVQTQLPLSSIFKKFGLDPSVYGAYGVGEIGTDTNAGGVSSAESVALGVNRKISPSVVLNLVEVRWLHCPLPTSDVSRLAVQQAGAPVVAGSSPMFTSNAFVISTGFSW